MHRNIRLIATLLAIAILIALVPFSASAQTAGDYDYELNTDGTVTVTAYHGTASNVVVPSEINGCTVTVIGANAFKAVRSIVSVEFPDTLKVIGANAFEACDTLQSVAFPDSLKSIGDYAFFNCMALTTVESTPYLFDIGYQAFHNTAWMMSAPKGFLYIGRVLYRYVGLTEDNAVITVPDYTAAIAPAAFEGQRYLGEVRLPVGIRSIGSYAFRNCYKLGDIRIPPSVTYIGDNVFLSDAAVIIKGVKGSYVNAFAVEQDIVFKQDLTLDYADGDMDKDGVLSSTDIRLLMKAVLMDDVYDHERFLSCDIIYDGKIATSDIREWMLLSIA